VLRAVGGDALDVERDVAADVHQQACPGAMRLSLRFEVGERHAEVLAVAIHELDPPPGVQDRQGRRHERVRGTQHDLVPDARELERREGATRPAPEGDGGDPVPFRPGSLEALHHRALGPPAGVDHVVPQLVDARAVASVETD
jgi:hypothetical protein